MRALRALVAGMAAVALLGAGGHRPRFPLDAPAAVTVTLVSAPNGVPLQAGAGAALADFGTVSANLRATNPGVSIVRRARSYDVVTQIGLRTRSADARNVSLTAFIDAPLPGIVVRIDGTVLGAVPRIFAANVPANGITHHRLEVEIPNSLNTAAVPSDIPLVFGAGLQ